MTIGHRSIYRFVIKPKAMNILLGLEFNQASKITDLVTKTGMTYNYLHIMFKEMEREKFIIKEKPDDFYNAPYSISLTKKGIALSQVLRKAKDIIENWEGESNGRK